MLMAPQVHQHIARSTIKAQYLVGLQDADVAHTPDVQYRQGFAGHAKNSLVKGWDQGRALPTCSHIAGSEIGHHADARLLDQPCRVVQLQGVAHAVVQLRLMPNGLAMGANGCNLTCLVFCCAQQALNSLGIKCHQGIG